MRREKGFRCWIKLLSMRPLDSVRRVSSVPTLLHCIFAPHGLLTTVRVSARVLPCIWSWWLRCLSSREVGYGCPTLWVNHYLNDAAFTGFSIYNRFLRLPVTGNFSALLLKVLWKAWDKMKKKMYNNFLHWKIEITQVFVYYLFCNLHCLYNFKKHLNVKEKNVGFFLMIYHRDSVFCYIINSNKVTWNICVFFPIPSKCLPVKIIKTKHTCFLGEGRQIV